MRRLELEEVQAITLEILTVVAEICEKEGLRYSIAYGTLLGAVRHRGFIPWDDDVDIMMPRDDYEKLLKYFRKNRKRLEPLKLIHYSTTRRAVHTIARIADQRYHAIERRLRYSDQGVFIDIFPIDGCGNSWEEVEQYFVHGRRLLFIVSSGAMAQYVRSSGGEKRDRIKRVAYKLTRLIGTRPFIWALDRRSRRKRFSDCKYVYSTVTWHRWDCALEASCFDRYVYLGFCGRKFRAFLEYDKILKKYYGDYMRLPATGARVGNHDLEVYER